MRLLLDTHVVLWWLAGDQRLDGDLKGVIEREPDVFLSSASVWEIAVKSAQGRLPGPPDLPERVLAAGLPTSASPLGTASLPRDCLCTTATRSTGCSSRRP